jgi:hypothetical protein
VLEALAPLWRQLPRGEVVALHFLEGFPRRTESERRSFLAIASELGRITREVMQRGPMDREAEIRGRLEQERRTLAEVDPVGRNGQLGEATLPEGSRTDTNRRMTAAATIRSPLDPS